MVKWEIHYVSDVQGIYFDEPIEFIEINSFKLRVLFIPNKDNIKDQIRFECTDYTSKDITEARGNTKLLVNNIINILADKYAASFSSLHITHEAKDGKQTLASAQITLYGINKVKLDKEAIDELVISFTDEKYLEFLSNNIQQSIYRDILFSENKVGNFIAMYSLLQEIITLYGAEEGKGQGKVDNFIRSKPQYWNANDEKNSARHIKNGIPVKETNYTWLRNQIGHTNEKTNIREVENDIITVYPSLVKLVQIAISQYTE